MRSTSTSGGDGRPPRTPQPRHCIGRNAPQEVGCGETSWEVRCEQ